ncbi:hypothetical protein, partial [Curtobacterium sp. B18]|uniref:hypothetical protein n=1 Tax=Curtobacterium sp. B18 TaxID=95614 RepID=UPI0004CEFAAB
MSAYDQRTMARGWRRFGAPTVAAVVGGSAAALAWWRLGPTTRGTVWAEDGGVSSATGSRSA